MIGELCTRRSLLNNSILRTEEEIKGTGEVSTNSEILPAC